LNRKAAKIASQFHRKDAKNAKIIATELELATHRTAARE